MYIVRQIYEHLFKKCTAGNEVKVYNATDWSRGM